MLSQTLEHYNVPLHVSPFTSALSRRQPPPELGASGIPAAKFLIVSRDSRSSGKSSSRNSLSEMLPNDEQGRDTAKNSSNFSKIALYYTESAIFRQSLISFKRRIFFNFRFWDFFDRFFNEAFLTPAFLGLSDKFEHL